MVKPSPSHSLRSAAPRASRTDSMRSLVVVISGTTTEVGKTWTACRLIERLLENGVTVSARKPVQSFDPAVKEPTDADQLAAATGESPSVVCPDHRWYEMPLAPPIAASMLGRQVPRLGELVDEHRRSIAVPRTDIELVELAGGLFSPMVEPTTAEIGDDGVAFVQAIGADVVVLVADAALGAIDAVRSHRMDPSIPMVVFLNRFDESSPVCAQNLRWLRDIDGFDVVTSIEGLADRIVGSLPMYCLGCGRLAGAGADMCAGGCRGQLEAQRFCQRCGRRLAVKIAPTSVVARCVQHGSAITFEMTDQPLAEPTTETMTS